MVRLAWDPRTREYAARSTRQGRSTAETIRCLKRYAAREVDRCLTVPPVTDPGQRA
jgi:transposase